MKSTPTVKSLSLETCPGQAHSQHPQPSAVAHTSAGAP
jgi:hypothetical protein